MDITKTNLTGISFCTGARGLEIGLERCGVNVRELCYVEIEIFVIANLVAAMEKGVLAPAPIWSNLKTFNPHPFRGMVDIFTAGYPCQPFSNAGKRKGEEDPRHLWPYIDNAIGIIQPGLCFFENVAGHLNLGYETVRNRLQELGYHVEEGIYAAQEVGAPHRRERLFILAVKHGYSLTGVVQDNSMRSRCNESARRHTAERTGEHGISKSLEAITGRNISGILGASGQAGQGTELSTEHFNMADPAYQRINRSGASRASGGHEYSDCSATGVGCLADSDNDGKSQQRGEISGESEETQTSEHRQGWNEVQRERSGSKFEPECADVAHSLRSRLQRQRRHEHRKRRPGVGQNRPAAESSVSLPEDRWPARPGEEQYWWEEPRTLTKEAESKVGLAVDGYSFREDLLRLAGNAVVPQQAEYAFRDLLRKHQKNNPYF